MHATIGYIDDIGSNRSRHFNHRVAALQVSANLISTICSNGITVISFAQIFCLDGDLILFLILSDIGRVVGDYRRNRRAPTSEIVALFCINFGGIGCLFAICLIGVHHIAISVRSRQGTMLTGHIGYLVLQLLQRYGDNCAAGDIVQGPVCTCVTTGVRSNEGDILTTLIGLCGLLTGFNACNMVAFRDINRHQEVSRIVFLVLEVNTVSIALQEFNIQGFISPLIERNNSLGIKRLTVFYNLNGNLVAIVNYPLPGANQSNALIGHGEGAVLAKCHTGGSLHIPAGELIAGHFRFIRYRDCGALLILLCSGELFVGAIRYGDALIFIFDFVLFPVIVQLQNQCALAVHRTGSIRSIRIVCIACVAFLVSRYLRTGFCSVHLSCVFIQRVAVIVCILEIILHRVAGVAGEIRSEADISRHDQVVQVNCFSLFIHPVGEVPKVVIQTVFRNYLVYGDFVSILHQQGLNHLTGIRINKFYPPILVLQVDHAVHMEAIPLILDDIPANRRCFIQGNVHQVGNLSGGRSCQNIAVYIVVYIVVARYGVYNNVAPLISFKIGRIHSTAAHRVVLVRFTVAICIRFPDEELRMHDIVFFSCPQGTGFNKPITATRTCISPRGGCCHLLIERILLAANRPAIEVLIVFFNGILVVAGDECNRCFVMPRRGKGSGNSFVYILTGVSDLVVAYRNLLLRSGIAVSFPLSRQRQIGIHRNRIIDIICFAIRSQVIYQVIVDGGENTAGNRGSRADFIGFVNRRICRRANRSTAAVLIGILHGVFRVIGLVHQTVIHICDRHHGKGLKIVQFAGDGRCALGHAGYHTIADRGNRTIVRFPGASSGWLSRIIVHLQIWIKCCFLTNLNHRRRLVQFQSHSLRTTGHRQRGHDAVAGHTIAVSSPGVQRHHGEHHDKCQKCGEYPFC